MMEIPSIFSIADGLHDRRLALQSIAGSGRVNGEGWCIQGVTGNLTFCVGNLRKTLRESLKNHREP